MSVAVATAVVVRTAYSSGQTRGGSETSRITPVDSSSSGIVVRGAMLVRAVMNAVVELGLGANALHVAATAAKGAGLAKHVGGTCFLNRCQNHPSFFHLYRVVLRRSSGERDDDTYGAVREVGRESVLGGSERGASNGEEKSGLHC